MGNTSKKLAAKCTLLTRDEQKYVASTFRTCSRNSDKVRDEELIVSGLLDAVLFEKHWGPLIDPRLAQFLSNFLFGPGSQKSPTCDFNRFAELYVHNVRGSVDERMVMLFNCLGMEYGEGVELPFQLLKEYCESIASTYIKMLKSSNSARAKAWMEKGFRSKAAHVQALGAAVAAAAADDPDAPPVNVTTAELYKWISTDTLLRHLAELVFVTLYGVNKKSEDSPSHELVPSLLPSPEGIESMPDYPAFIDLSHIVWINRHLPRKHQHKWRFLFSSHIHGESFSTMAGRIIDQGPSVVIIEDSSGHIFGGFASSEWLISPTFSGNEESFLFALAPKMRVYNATTFNNHYQYLNNHTKTMPNGLMMGGQFEFEGIWIEADPFGQGKSAESCSTFRGFKRLSKDQNFHIRSLEVWGVGDKPLTVKESDERDASVLDGNNEARAILELAGKSRHSEGYREPVDE